LQGFAAARVSQDLKTTRSPPAGSAAAFNFGLISGAKTRKAVLVCNVGFKGAHFTGFNWTVGDFFQVELFGGGPLAGVFLFLGIII
jgi:hypothetical protein